MGDLVKRDPFALIKRLVLKRQAIFTDKAERELAANDLTRDEVYESIWGAPGIQQTLNSKNPETGDPETLYVIHGLTLDGIPVYTKGKVVEKGKELYFYVLISSKRLK